MGRSVKVVPSILTDNPGMLETLIRKAETFSEYVQIDIMDGKFVPSRSVTWMDISLIHTRLSWEAHLMVEYPEVCLQDFRKAGAQKAIFHYEATSMPREIIRLSRKLHLAVGLAINPETPVSAVAPLVGEVDNVLLLAVQPGFYGSKFIPETLNKVGQLRAIQPDMEIGLDGGIKESNIQQVARSGVDVMYVGSAIFLQPDPLESFRRLHSLIDEMQELR